MKLFSVLISLLMFCIEVNAQYNIQGTVVDNDKNLIAFSDISLLHNDSVLAQTVTDSLGNFQFYEIGSGSYEIIVDYWGSIKQVSIEISQQDVITKIELDSLVSEFEGVTVASKKLLIERKVDRLVFNTSNSIASQGTNAYELLENTPMVVVRDNGSISIVGKGGLAVMINDQLLNMANEAIIAYLKSIPSDIVDRIEVITSPPSKYDAEGNNGLINIVLKKNRKEGWRTTFSGAMTQNAYWGNNLGANVNYNYKRFSASATLSNNKNIFSSTENFIINYHNRVWDTYTERKNINNASSGNLNVRYNISPKIIFGGVFDISFSKANNKGIDSGFFRRSKKETIDSLITTPAHLKNDRISQSINGYITYQIDSARNRNVSFNTTLFNYKNEAANNFTTSLYHDANFTFQGEKTVLNQSLFNYAAWLNQLDLAFPYSWGKIEAGVKYSKINNNSKLDYYDFRNGELSWVKTNSDKFSYDEDIFASYVSANIRINKQLEFKAGLRYEHTDIKGHSIFLDSAYDNSYWHFFPTAYLLYTPNENSSFVLNYSKRINRPSYSLLNPFRWYQNNISYTTGNPMLLPSFAHNIELSYSFRNNFNITGFVSNLEQSFAQITLVNTNSALQIVKPYNFFNQKYFGIDLSYTLQKFNWLESYNYVSAYYSQAQSYVANLVAENLSGYGLYLSSNNTFILNEKQTFFCFINYYHQFPYRDGFTLYKNKGSLDLGIRCLLLHKQLQLSASITDILREQKSMGINYLANATQTFNGYYDARTFKIAASFSFGNNSVKRINKSINDDEKKRMN